MKRNRRLDTPKGGSDAPKGSDADVWNFMKSYESTALVPSMRKKLGKYAGKNVHK